MPYFVVVVQHNSTLAATGCNMLMAFHIVQMAASCESCVRVHSIHGEQPESAAF